MIVPLQIHEGAQILILFVVELRRRTGRKRVKKLTYQIALTLALDELLLEFNLDLDFDLG